MEQKKVHTLGKQERLKSRKAIESLFASGISFSLYPFKVVYIQTTGESQLQCGFSVSKRNFKKAVDRNKIKRQMREAYRLQNDTLKKNVADGPIKLQVFIIYIGKEVPEYLFVSSKIAGVLKRLKKIIDETTPVPA